MQRSLVVRNIDEGKGQCVCVSVKYRVATVREKVLENEKSGDYIFSQGNLKKMKKVMEKSGNSKIFLKRC